MKRKRGHKKANPKRPHIVEANEALLNVGCSKMEDNSGLDDFHTHELESRMEVGIPSPEGSDQPDKFANINSDGLIEKPLEKSTYGRVKVKLRTSKALEPQPTSSDAPMLSDTDKSSLQVGLEKQGVVAERMEDSANSFPAIKLAVSGNSSKKAGSIKIKSSRGLSSSSIKRSSKTVLVKDESTYPEEVRLPHQDPRYNKAELNAALEVIKKVMKMDAAEPFNVPVNPIALGIPDYFDVIDTPMDFGTICNNLEKDIKYINSEDVHNDVQFIWENCHKYNNKGDYILELMKRVKKNFTKYWTAAGLYNEHHRRVNGVEGIQADDVMCSSQGKIHIKSGHMKHKTRKRHGIKRHKEDCLCAICVMRRRRREREENSLMVEDQIETSERNLAQEFKQEEMSLGESPCGEDTSSNMDNSLDPDADADSEEKGEVKINGTEHQYSPLVERKEEEKEDEMDIQRRGDAGTSEQSHLGERCGRESTSESLTEHAGDFGGRFQNNTEKEEISTHCEEEAIQQQKHKELSERHKKSSVFEELLHFENPMLPDICGILFPENPKSIWRGPHSLVHHHRSARSSSIHEAVATFMK